MTLQVRALGMAWYRRQDYGRILEIMEDAHLLPPTFDKWLGKAEKLESQQKKLLHEMDHHLTRRDNEVKVAG